MPVRGDSSCKIIAELSMQSEWETPSVAEQVVIHVINLFLESALQVRAH